jgi:hypothetical protein
MIRQIHLEPKTSIRKHKANKRPNPKVLSSLRATGSGISGWVGRAGVFDQVMSLGFGWNEWWSKVNGRLQLCMVFYH